MKLSEQSIFILTHLFYSHAANWMKRHGRCTRRMCASAKSWVITWRSQRSWRMPKISSMNRWKSFEEHRRCTNSLCKVKWWRTENRRRKLNRYVQDMNWLGSQGQWSRLVSVWFLLLSLGNIIERTKLNWFCVPEIIECVGVNWACRNSMLFTHVCSIIKRIIVVKSLYRISLHPDSM